MSPICTKHGQVYGDGCACATCCGIPLSWPDPPPLATVYPRWYDYNISTPVRTFKFIFEGRTLVETRKHRPITQFDEVPKEYQPRPRSLPQYNYTLKAQSAIREVLRNTIVPFHEMIDTSMFGSDNDI